jgi:type III pantothenate kinase
MMILAVDIGNTRTNYGAYDGSTLLRTFSHDTLKDGKAIGADVLHEMSQIARPDIVGIASVVPEATQETARSIDAILKAIPIRIVGNEDVPFINKYRDPHAVGIDRLLGAFAAYENWGRPAKQPVIVIDFGTATTYNCVTSSGEYLGGAISLGIASSARALSSFASQLPNIPLEFPPGVLGSTTIESMQSGILFAALAQTEGMIARFTKEVFQNEEPIVVATGGLAKLLEGKTTAIHHYDSQLVLEGIRLTLSAS